MKRIDWKMLRKVYESNPKMNLKMLADRYHVNYGTVRNHKAKFHWTHDNVTSRQMVEVLDKYGLTNRQRTFCEYYLKTYNAYEAYKLAFNCKWSTAHTNAYRLLRNNKIQSALSKLHKKQAVHLHIDRSDVLNKMVRTYMSADPGKFINFGNKKVISKSGHKYRRSYAYFKNNHGDTSDLQSIGLDQNGHPTVDYGNINQLGKFLFDVLPDQPTPARQDSLVRAFKAGYQSDNKLKSENRKLRLKLKSISKGDHYED